VCQRREGGSDGPQSRRGARSAGGLQQETRRDRPDAGQPSLLIVWRTGQTPRLGSGREWQSAQFGEGGVELVLPGPALGKMKGEAACLAGDASGQGEEAPPQGLGGCHRFAQSQMMGQSDWQDQPSIGHQAVIVEGDLDAIRVVRGSIRWVLLVSGWFSVSKTIIPEAGSTFLPLQHPATITSSVDWG